MRDMLGREDAISVGEAQRRIAEQVVIKELPYVVLPIEDSYRRILAEDILSTEDLPSFARSTVDGFAVHSSDTFGATEGLPSYMEVSHEIAMGEEVVFLLKKGAAARIPTGGMVPGGADAVVMFENVQYVNEKIIEVLKPVAPAENVISAGEDIRRGEYVLRRGSLLRPQDIAALAGIGITEITVFEKPKVAIISTGDEIVAARSPLRPGQVRDINSYTLAGLIAEYGGIPVKRGIVRDICGEIKTVVEESLKESAIVIITGGSSVGVMDMTARVINGLGSPGVLFHGVTLKPGKPTIGGVVNGVPMFGLPGHPAAVSVCFDLFVKPVLTMFTGMVVKGILKNRTVTAKLAKNVSSSAGREEHIRVALEERNGELWAFPVLGKSGLIRTLVLADGKIVIPAQSRGLGEGETLAVTLF